MKKEKKALLENWKEITVTCAIEHRKRALIMLRTYYVMGVASVFFSSLVAALSINITSAEGSCSNGLMSRCIVQIVCSVVAGTVTGISTFVDPSKRSIIHKTACDEYNKIRYEIEVLQSDFEVPDAEERFRNIREMLQAINIQSPIIPIAPSIETPKKDPSVSIPITDDTKMRSPPRMEMMK